LARRESQQLFRRALYPFPEHRLPADLAKDHRMAVTSQAIPKPRPAASARASGARFSLERFLSPMLLAPSAVAIFVFVYGFIGYTFYVSLTNWRSAKPDMSIRQPLGAMYGDLFAQTRFQIDMRNTVVFTVAFLVMGAVGGLGLAILLDRHIRGSGFFRSVFLFPYALSFITTGVAWSWIFNPETGVNLLINATGINDVLAAFGAGPLKPGWITDPAVVWQLNQPLAAVYPPAAEWSLKLGVPVAILPVALAAAWQLSGFAMAMYLAGLGTISHEVREAASLDGATDFRLYKDVIIPLLNPITVSILIIFTHVSLKIFDLVFAMSGKGPGFATDVPGIFVYEMIFRAQRYNLGAAASIVMLVGVSLVIVPYLARQLKSL
jgi:glucose/mannose transport system permease protein